MTTRARAAVLVPVFRDDEGSARVVLIRRVERGLHGGQIGFPGGRIETGDTSHVAAALREAQEEIGLAPERVEVLASLRTVVTRSTGFEIRPFLGRIRPPASWRLQASEVSEVLTPSVARLAEPRRLTTMRVTPPTLPVVRRVPCLRLDDDTVVWGATYRILRPLLLPLLDGRWRI